MNAHSITHRRDYYDVRAQSYIEVIAEIIRLARLEENKDISLFLFRHALVEARHFLGLYRKRVQNTSGMKANFISQISLHCLFKGISNISDALFFIKLMRKIWL
ncbi:hypothetical protein ACE2AK_19410 [Rahnella perminowiae]|uniref:hypothetical protein n=1 Tax=Rahnella perminowiae TaxID=2816244 RepID=UPI00215B8405|nr:hypothetical protein [Rahnella perminowiae]MCR9000431.1 hypothetical protein [Rahnella perminowiae]